MHTPTKLAHALVRELAVDAGCDPRPIAKTAAGGVPKGLNLQRRIKLAFQRRGLGHLAAPYWLLLGPPQNRLGFRKAQACGWADRTARSASVMTFSQRLVLGLRRALKRVAALVREATRPAGPALGLVSDSLRPRRTLIAENVVLRQQLLVLRRQVKRPALTRMDRLVIVGAST